MHSETDWRLAVCEKWIAAKYGDVTVIFKIPGRYPYFLKKNGGDVPVFENHVPVFAYILCKARSGWRFLGRGKCGGKLESGSYGGRLRDNALSRARARARAEAALRLAVCVRRFAAKYGDVTVIFKIRGRYPYFLKKNGGGVPVFENHVPVFAYILRKSVKRFYSPLHD